MNKTIKIGDQEYNLDVLLKLAQAGPSITVETKEIDLAPLHNEDLADHKCVIFFKKDAKYRVIAGSSRVEAGVRSGRLISTVGLKKAKVQEKVVPKEDASRPALEQAYSRATRTETTSERTPRRSFGSTTDNNRSTSSHKPQWRK